MSASLSAYTTNDLLIPLIALTTLMSNLSFCVDIVKSMSFPLSISLPFTVIIASLSAEVILSGIVVVPSGTVIVSRVLFVIASPFNVPLIPLIAVSRNIVTEYFCIVAPFLTVIILTVLLPFNANVPIPLTFAELLAALAFIVTRVVDASTYV